MDDKALSKLIQKLPSVLGYSIEENLEPKLSWLKEGLGMDDKALSKLIQTLPAVLSCSIEETLNPSSYGSKRGSSWMIRASASLSRHYRKYSL